MQTPPDAEKPIIPPSMTDDQIDVIAKLAARQADEKARLSAKHMNEKREMLRKHEKESADLEKQLFSPQAAATPKQEG